MPVNLPGTPSTCKLQKALARHSIALQELSEQGRRSCNHVCRVKNIEHCLAQSQVPQAQSQAPQVQSQAPRAQALSSSAASQPMASSQQTAIPSANLQVS